MFSDFDYEFYEWCLSLPFDVLWSAVMEWERMLGYRGHTRTLVDPLVSETKAAGNSFGVLPILPHETTGFAATPNAPPPETASFQHQEHIGHYDGAYDNNEVAFDSSVDDSTIVQDGQFDDFTPSVAEDVQDLRATASSSTSDPPTYTSETARDNEGFLDPNVVLPVAHRAAGPSNASFNTNFERFSQSPTPSSSRSSSVVSSRPPSATPSFSNGNPSGRNNIRSLSPTPPLTRSGSVVSTRSQNLTTPSPVATPQVLKGHCHPHAHGNFGYNIGHNAPMTNAPWGPVVGPSVHPTYYRAQVAAQPMPGYGHYPVSPFHTPGGVGISPQPAARWQQGIAQQVPPVPVHGQYYAQMIHVGQGRIPVQHGGYPQQMPTTLQRAQVQQTAPPHAPTKGKTKSSNPRVKRSPAHATSKTDALGGPVVERPKKLYACPSCGKTFSHPRTRKKHHESVCEKRRWYCPNPDCGRSMHATDKPPEERGISRLDRLKTHVEEQCGDWFEVFDDMYPKPDGTKRKRRVIKAKNTA